MNLRQALRSILGRKHGKRPTAVGPTEALTYMMFHGAPARGIIHVGANDAAEFESYVTHGVGRALWIEPLPDVYETLRRTVSAHPGHRAINLACTDVDDRTVTLNVASNRGESSSILTSSRHSEFFPDIVFDKTVSVKTVTLDTLILRHAITVSDYDLLVIDTQGAELLVLKGAQETLASLSAVYVEVSEIPLYEGSCTWPEIHDHLSAFGFSLKHMHIGQHYFGNAFYIRNSATAGWTG